LVLNDVFCTLVIMPETRMQNKNRLNFDYLPGILSHFTGFCSHEFHFLSEYISNGIEQPTSIFTNNGKSGIINDHPIIPIPQQI